MNHDRRWTRWGRRVMWAMAGLGAAAMALLVLGWALPAGSAAAGHGRYGVRIERGVLEIVRGSHDVSWMGRGWLQSASGQKGLVINASSSVWRPNVRTARMVMGTSAGGATRVTLDALYVPLWPWVAGPGLIAGLLLWRLPRRHGAGMCAACGYDVRGIRGEKCPECGRAIESALRRMMRRIGAFVGWGAIGGLGDHAPARRRSWARWSALLIWARPLARSPEALLPLTQNMP